MSVIKYHRSVSVNWPQYIDTGIAAPSLPVVIKVLKVLIQTVMLAVFIRVLFFLTFQDSPTGTHVLVEVYTPAILSSVIARS